MLCCNYTYVAITPYLAKCFTPQTSDLPEHTLWRTFGVNNNLIIGTYVTRYHFLDHNYNLNLELVIASPLSLPSVPSKSITRVHGSMFWAFANHIPLVVCDLKISRMLPKLQTRIGSMKTRKVCAKQRHRNIK